MDSLKRTKTMAKVIRIDDTPKKVITSLIRKSLVYLKRSCIKNKVPSLIQTIKTFSFSKSSINPTINTSEKFSVIFFAVDSS
jgi:hypothetical protein